MTESRRGQAIAVFAALLENCSHLLYSYSEQNEPKVSFNASTLVIAVCALTDKDVSHFLQDWMMKLHHVVARNVLSCARILCGLFSGRRGPHTAPVSVYFQLFLTILLSQKCFQILYRRLPLLTDNLVGIVSGMAKIPETARRAIFIRSRLKDILLANLQESLGIRLAQALKEQNAVYPVQLVKEYPQLASLFE